MLALPCASFFKRVAGDYQFYEKRKKGKIALYF